MRLQLAAVFLAQAEAIRCIVCQESVDHHGNILGTSSKNCLNGDQAFLESEYSQECPTGYNYCAEELVADWFPRGFQQFTMRRLCRTTPSPPNNKCISSTLTGIKYKDCLDTCQQDNCNKENSVWEHAAVKDEATGKPREISCYSCNSDFDQEDDVDGMPYCYSTPAEQAGGIECPTYANAGCFKSKALIDKDNGDSEEHYFKGCSTFPKSDKLEDNEPECITADIIGETWLMCDTICDGEKDVPCNGGTPRGGGKMCYTCETSINHEGQLVGWGDPSCLTNPTRYQLEICDEDQDVCVTEFRADWKLLGQQTYTMRRGCGKSENVQNDCLTIQAENFKAKQCTETCQDLNVAGCNNETTIFDNFKTNQVESCRTCSDHVYGNQVPSDCAKNVETSAECPPYATAACFSSRFVYDTNGLQESDTYHGCSAFKTTKDEKKCFTVNVEDGFNQQGQTQSTCKESCDSNDCNLAITEIITDPISEHFCAVCTVRMDHFNQTVGEGDARCWGENRAAMFSQQCPEGHNFCITDIEVDWMPNGDQHTTVRRSCATEPAPETCASGAIQTWQYKDCATTCSNNLLAPCNIKMYDTALMFSDETWHGTSTCYNCETHTDGDSLRDCGPNFEGPNAARNIVPCPKYANRGCFTSILRHEEGGETYDDIIRGCSTFDQEYACSGYTEREISSDGIATGNEIEWNSCKESCNGNNCNNEKAEIAGDNRCFVCTAQVNSHGDSIGLGDSYCFSDQLTGDYNEAVVDCGRDEYCIVDLEVDWLPQGDQITTVRRRCAKEEIYPGCVTTITNGWAAKDCYTNCKGALCNDDLDVADLLTENLVSECYNCRFNEITGSNHEDVEQCKESPIEETKTDCPRWARAACFVADTVVKEDDGSDLVTIYRGCSAFSEEQFGSMMKCSSITVDVGVDTDIPDRRVASICKQLCSEADDCNNIRYPDFEPPADDECPPCNEPTTTETSTQSSSSTQSSTQSSSTQSSTDKPTDEPTDKPSESPTTESTTSTTAAAVAPFAVFSALLAVLL